MAQENEQEKSLLEKLRHTYRLVVMNNETFEEIGSYRLTLLNVYIFLSTIVVVVALFVVLVIAFTPVKKYIPGYGDVSANEELYRINQELEELERLQAGHESYFDNVQRMLVGEVQKAEDVPENIPVSKDSIEKEDPKFADVDEQIRMEVEQQEIGEVARQTRATNFSPRDVPLEQMYFSPPLTGEISAGFMPDKQHFGVDVLAPKNTAIKAAMDGYVFLSDWTLETGNTIGIQHSNNIITFYKHNSILLKKAGSYVKAGEAVAIIGNTGTLTDGPHLHFELWHKGKAIDPVEYINF
jgi:murein DD-endopeptidase MepM/ murein hydrolase activator NlpD